MDPTKSFQDLIFALDLFWAAKGCAVLQPHDVEMGAGTFHPATTLPTLGPNPWHVAFVQPSRRPTDGRFGENPNRLQKFHQYQVIMKPSPVNAQELCLGSLAAIGLDPLENDIRFVEDDWESPTLGAAGLGWEVWCNGLEIIQFTYFQQMGGIPCNPVSFELTYGLERIAMVLQGVTHFKDLVWNRPSEDNSGRKLTYGDVCLVSEQQFSAFNFTHTDPALLRRDFEQAEKTCQDLLAAKLIMPAYDYCVKSSHLFNLLDARGALSVTERATYIKRIRDLAKACCEGWMASQHQSDQQKAQEGSSHA